MLFPPPAPRALPNHERQDNRLERAGSLPFLPTAQRIACSGFARLALLGDRTTDSVIAPLVLRPFLDLFLGSRGGIVHARMNISPTGFKVFAAKLPSRQQGRKMFPHDTEDVILRENRRAELARRLILHGVHTEFISLLTGLTRNRLATFRRRLMVADKTRRRGPIRSPLRVFLGSSRSRAEAAALSSLCSIFQIPIEPRVSSIPKIVSFDFGERLCETYEAYCACYPKTRVQLEELIVLRSSLAKGDLIRLGKCRSCRCLLLINRFEGSHECWHCDSAPINPKSPESNLRTARGRARS
jgi:hypothetical protein